MQMAASIMKVRAKKKKEQNGILAFIRLMVCDNVVAINLQCIQFNHHTQETVVMNYTLCVLFLFMCVEFSSLGV